MAKKIIILTLVAYYLPGYKSGGPVRTISNMVDQLGDEFEFRIVTSDRDSFEVKPYRNIKVNTWNDIGNAKAYYVDKSLMTLASISQLIQRTPHDVLYLNSFFNVKFTGLPLIARRLRRIPLKPVVLAPRGEFSAGALKIKELKKRLYLKFSNIFGIYQDLTWQASSKYEAVDISRVFGEAAKRIFVASDIPAVIPYNSLEATQLKRDSSDTLRVVFLSRITPKKNLDFALKVLERVTIPTKFDIYGLVDDESYWQHCRELMKSLPAHISVTYHGVIPHEKVVSTLQQYDLFFLPTRGENFGHVIPEALSAGVPALISDQTPWKDLDQYGVGYVRSLDIKDDFVEVIHSLSQRDIISRMEQRKKTFQYAKIVSRNKKFVIQNRDLFLNLLMSK